LRWILATVARVQVPAETTMKTIGVTHFSPVDESLADNHLPGTGWRQQGHAAIQK